MMTIMQIKVTTRTLLLAMSILRILSNWDSLILRIFQRGIILRFCWICCCIRMNRLWEMLLRYSLYTSPRKPT
jgi:hypothetical protein